MQRTVISLGIFSVLREELSKLGKVVAYDMDQQLSQGTSSVKKWGTTLKGEDGETKESVERLKRKKQKYEENLKEAWAKQQEQLAKEAEERKNLSTFERTKLKFTDLKDAFTKMASTQSGVVALIQHCTAAHAADVAADVDIDVKNINIVTQKGSVGEGEKVVGYIDAPMASEEEVMVFAEKLQKSCPAANLHGQIEWRQAPTSNTTTPEGGGVKGTSGGEPVEGQTFQERLQQEEREAAQQERHPVVNSDQQQQERGTGALPPPFSFGRREPLFSDLKAKEEGEGLNQDALRRAMSNSRKSFNEQNTMRNPSPSNTADDHQHSSNTRSTSTETSQPDATRKKQEVPQLTLDEEIALAMEEAKAKGIPAHKAVDEVMKRRLQGELQ